MYWWVGINNSNAFTVQICHKINRGDVMRNRILKYIFIGIIIAAYISMVIIAEVKYEVSSVKCAIIGFIFGFLLGNKIIPYISDKFNRRE